MSERGPNQFLGALTMLDPDFMGGRWKTALVARTDVQVLFALCCAGPRCAVLGHAVVEGGGSVRAAWG